MSEEKSNEVECSLCGRDGVPPKACSTCHGSAAVRPRQFTLSDVRAGRVTEPDRYGKGGTVSPKTNDPLWSGTE